MSGKFILCCRVLLIRSFYQPGFFRKLGFEDIDKKELPHKIRADCIHCSMFPDCDEEALMYQVRNGVV